MRVSLAPLARLSLGIGLGTTQPPILGLAGAHFSSSRSESLSTGLIFALRWPSSEFLAATTPVDVTDGSSDGQLEETKSEAGHN